MYSILYVDDEKHLLDSGSIFLERTTGFTVIPALSATEALDLLEQRGFDAIVSDYQMPRMDGIAFLKEVRARYGDLPFILFTGRGREEVVIEAINSGADFYLQKGGNNRALFAELAHMIRMAVERRKAAEILQQREERFRNIYTESPIAIESYSHDGTLIDINPACCALFGVHSADAVRGFSLFSDPNIPESKRDLLRSGQPLRFETEFDFDLVTQLNLYPTTRIGKIQLDVMVAPIRRGDGSIGQYLVQILDISDRKLMESEIRSLNTVLEQRVKDRTAALETEIAHRLAAEERLRDAYDEKVILLKEIHHRVKNNLQIIASLLNLQARSITDEPTLAALRESRNRVRTMAIVHEQLYRAEDLAHISLRDCISTLADNLSQIYDARARQIQIAVEIPPFDVDIDSAIPLGLIINELLSNALKYAFPARQAGRIRISIEKNGRGDLEVIVEDNGVGISPDLDWKRPASLGLQLVRTLTEQMNGTIELDRADGTRFTLHLCPAGNPDTPRPGTGR